MLKQKALILATAWVIGLATPLMAEDISADTVVARVGETEITVGHMIAMTTSLPDAQQQMPAEILYSGVLERLIQQEAIIQSRTEYSKLTQLQLENEQRSLKASEIVNELSTAVQVTPDQLQAAYDLRFAEFSTVREFNASHILVKTEEEAKAVLKELEGGADFAELAKLHSTGPSGPNGGNLGWFGPGRMVPAFEAAVAELEDGQISEPVETRFGWHVIILNESRLPRVPTFDELQTELESQVWRNTLTDQIAALVDAVAVERVEIEGLDPGILSQLNLLEE